MQAWSARCPGLSALQALQLKISRELMSTEAVTSSTFSAFGLSW